MVIQQVVPAPLPKTVQHNHDKPQESVENKSENNQSWRLDRELPLGFLILSINL